MNGMIAIIHDEKWPKTIEKLFFAILTSLTTYSTHNILLWATEWCPVILWYTPWFSLHSWPYVVTLWATIAAHLRPKMAKNHRKMCFWLKLFYRPLYGVQLSHDIPHDAFYTHIVTLCAMITIHPWPKMTKNNWNNCQFLPDLGVPSG